MKDGPRKHPGRKMVCTWITDAEYERLAKEMQSLGLYKPTLSNVLRRGLELAIAELEEMAKR